MGALNRPCSIAEAPALQTSGAGFRMISEPRVHGADRSRLECDGHFARPANPGSIRPRVWCSRPAPHRLRRGRLEWGARSVYCTAGMAVLIGTSVVRSGRSMTGPPLLSVAGTYQTQVSLVPDRNTCGAVTVQDNPTLVTHTPGARVLALTHAGHPYQGTIDSAARFATTPTTLSVRGGQFTLTIDGQFKRSGFDATVEVDVRQSMTPQQCLYFVHWVGRRDGPPNTIP